MDRGTRTQTFWAIRITTNLLGEFYPTTLKEILDHAPLPPCANNAVLLAFSGGNDSRCLAHAVKEENPAPWPWGCFDKSAHTAMKLQKDGQEPLTGIESFPICQTCERSVLAKRESGLNF